MQGVSRALRLLNALAHADKDGLTLTNAAAEVQATKSTTFSLLRTLMEFDYVTSSEHGPRYRLGPAVVHLADRYSGSLPWLEVARPVAQRLTDKTGWTSRVASHVGGHPIFEERIDGPSAIRFHTELGIRELPHVSAAGKAILAHLSESEVRRIAAECGLPRRTRNTITDVEVLLNDLALAAERGYAVDDGEDDEGVLCIAASFSAPETVPIGAISITGLKSEMPAWRVNQVGELVREAADEISRALDGSPAPP